MMPVSYFDFTTHQGLELYQVKAQNNVDLFGQILGTRAEVVGQMLSFESSGNNFQLLKRIREVSGLSKPLSVALT